MNIIMDKELLRNVMKSIIGFSDSDISMILVDMAPGGMILTAVDAQHVSLMVVAIGKKAMAGITVEKTCQIVFTDDNVRDIAEFCEVCIKGDKDRTKTVTNKNRLLKAAADKKNEDREEGEKKVQAVLIEKPDVHDITIEFHPEARKIDMHMDQLKRSTDIGWQENVENTLSGSSKTLSNVYNTVNKIGELDGNNLEEVLSYIRAGQSFEGDPQRTVEIVKDEERFEMEVEIETNDHVIIDLNKALKKKIQGGLKLTLQVQNLYMGLRQASRLTDKVFIYGATDHPMIISSTNEKPENANNFVKPVTVWYLLAPRIGDE
jgi:hypothetical protein